MGYDIEGVGQNKSADVELTNPRLIGIVRLVSGDTTYTLSPASESRGRMFFFVKTDTNATTVTVDAYSSETINGSTTQTMTEQYETMRIYCDGSAWYIV